MVARLDKLLVTDAQLDNLIVDSRTRDLDQMINEIRIYAKKGIKFFAIDSKMKITSATEGRLQTLWRDNIEAVKSLSRE